MAQHQDSAWKEILEQYLPQFFELCLPDLHALIDWSKPWIPRDKELVALAPDALAQTRIVDKLFQVYLKTGEEQWIFIHIEIQGRPEATFKERMYFYITRLYDRYRRPILSCAVLTDENKNWRPQYHEVKVENSGVRVDFYTVKLLDFLPKKEMLEASSNPFASVILVQLEALGLKRVSGETRLKIKVKLMRKLHEKGFSKEEISHLIIFLDWLITLPKDLEKTYHTEVQQIEEKKSMAYVTTFERIGIEIGMEKGMQQGMQQGMEKGLAQGRAEGLERGIKQGRQEGLSQGQQKGEAALLLRVMIRKFGAVSKHHRKLIAQSDCEQLLALAERVLEAKSLEEIFEEIT